MWKKKDQRKLAELRMQMHSKPKARQHVSARPVRNHAFCSVGRTRADFPDDLLSVATSCLDLSASLNGRGAPISPRHSPVCATNTREERILFLTRAQAVLARACSKGCSRRVEFSLSSLSFPLPSSLSLSFTKEDFYRRIFMHRALSACCDRSIATHEGIRAPRDIANLSRFVLASLRCTPPSESKLFEVSVSWVGLGRRPTPSGQIWTRLSKPFDQFETVYSGVTYAHVHGFIEIRTKKEIVSPLRFEIFTYRR